MAHFIPVCLGIQPSVISIIAILIWLNPLKNSAASCGWLISILHLEFLRYQCLNWMDCFLALGYSLQMHWCTGTYLLRSKSRLRCEIWSSIGPYPCCTESSLLAYCESPSNPHIRLFRVNPPILNLPDSPIVFFGLLKGFFHLIPNWKKVVNHPADHDRMHGNQSGAGNCLWSDRFLICSVINFVKFEDLNEVQLALSPAFDLWRVLLNMHHTLPEEHDIVVISKCFSIKCLVCPE